MTTTQTSRTTGASSTNGATNGTPTAGGTKWASAPRPRDASDSRRGRSVIVVGGGLAGLSCAVECQSAGLAVTLIERNGHLGGKMNVLEDKGFSFDMGPTILTLPQVLRGVLRRAGRRVEDEIDLINLDPQWRCFYDDGTVINLRMDPAQTARDLDAQFPGKGAGEGFERFLAFSRRMMRLSEKVFFYNDLGGVMDMMKKPPKEPGVLRDALAMRMHSTVGGTVHGYIKEPHVRQMCEHFLQYVGSSPFLAPAILSLIAAAQADHGCWYSMPPKGAPAGTRGGTRCVARALERVLEQGGATIIRGVGVERIIVEDGTAKGVRLDDGRTLTADAVVSNCDVQRTYRDLMKSPEAGDAQRDIASKYTPACSGVVLYLGLDRQYEHLAHHNFLFSRDSLGEFDDIYTKGIPAKDPTLYLAVPSRTDPTQAPKGHEALYILVHTAYKREGQKWEGPGGLLEQYRPVILEKLARCGKMPGIERHIVVEHALTPASIERMYNAEGGAIYGLASHGLLRGGFKPKNRSNVADRLYFAGGSVNPGPGVPMVLMSGVTAARCVAEDLGLDVPAIALGEGVESLAAAGA
jgi:phytoene desaturase